MLGWDLGDAPAPPLHGLVDALSQKFIWSESKISIQTLITPHDIQNVKFKLDCKAASTTEQIM